MLIQSLSVVVPSKKCINDCGFCVSKMHGEQYENKMDGDLPFYDLYLKDYLKRLEYARDNGVDTVMLTGNAEPQQNRHFLKDFGLMMMLMDRPFRWIEMQTTGTLLDDPYLRFLRNHVGVTTISLSLSSFLDNMNAAYTGMKKQVQIDELCAAIKKYDFNLRLSLNMTDQFAWDNPQKVLLGAKSLGADQVIIRKLYYSGKNTQQDRWIEMHGAPGNAFLNMQNYIKENGTPLRILEYGQTAYDIFGMSTVVDDKCMAEDVTKDIRYLILREDGKLYFDWANPASKIF